MSDLERAVIELDGFWPERDYHTFKFLVQQGGGGRYFARYTPTSEKLIGTYSPFMETRARLENKPPEAEWPKWAAGVAQDSGGKWHAYSQMPDNLSRTQHYASGDCEYKELSTGHVFGDWRKSWTPRAQPACTPEDAAFKAEAKAVEWVNGFPPIGCECEMMLGGIDNWCKVEITAHAKRGVCYILNHDGIEYYASEGFHCRPIKKERDRVIDLAVKQRNIRRDYRESMEHLYDLGMLRMPETEK